MLCCCLHVLIKFKSRSLHECCVILIFILHCTWEHPIPEVLSDCSLASCAVDVCVRAHENRPGTECQGLVFYFILSDAAARGWGWLGLELASML